MADVVRSFDGQYLTHEEIELVADTISKHMGQWNTDKKTDIELPKPNNKFARMVHVADYLASRKCLTMDFSDYTMKQEPLEFDENYKLTFGKHSGQRLIDVYNSAPDYIAWCEENLHKPDLLKMIKAMKEYLNNKENE
jgi:hypothetical protein